MSQFQWTKDRIARADLRKHPELTYLFGDNAEKRGMGGMAKEMRGEPNAVGVPTKWEPTMTAYAFFDDNHNSLMATQHMDCAIRQAERLGKPIVVPVGIGAGLAEMPTRCPQLYAWLMKRLERPEGL